MFYATCFQFVDHFVPAHCVGAPVLYLLNAALWTKLWSITFREIHPWPPDHKILISAFGWILSLYYKTKDCIILQMKYQLPSSAMSDKTCKNKETFKPGILKNSLNWKYYQIGAKSRLVHMERHIWFKMYTLFVCLQVSCKLQRTCLVKPLSVLTIR